MTERESIIRRQIELSEIIGPPGHEQAVAGYLLDAVRPLVDEAWIDPMGNVLAFRSGRPAAQPLRILLDAHMDEVGFMVSHVEESGFLRLATLGNIDRRLLLGTTLELLSDRGERVPGIVGSLPPHVTSPAEREKLPELADMFLDIGAASAAEVERRGVHVGTVGSFATRTRMLTDEVMAGKAFDDRTACNVVLHVLQRLRSEPTENGILCSFSVQEEVGMRGALPAAHTLRPDLALVLENTTATDVPGVTAGKVVAQLGKGPAVTTADHTHIVPSRVLDRIRKAAEGLPWQYKKPVYGGTNAGSLATSRSGVPTGVVSVPCRYIHAPAAMLHIGDIIHTVELVSRFCTLGGEAFLPAPSTASITKA